MRILFILLFFVSCSHSSLHTKPHGEWEPFVAANPINVNLTYSETDKNSGKMTQKESFEYGLIRGGYYAKVPVTNVVVDEKAKCSVQVFYNSDRSFSNWQSWVGPLTLNIFPTKFHASYKVVVKNGDQESVQEFKTETWHSIFLIPAVLFTTWESSRLIQAGNITGKLVEKTCGEKSIDSLSPAQVNRVNSL